MGEGTISVKDIESGIPEKARGHILVDAAVLSEGAWPVIHAFWKAMAALLPSLRLTMPVHVFFATTPFEVTLPNAKFTFALGVGAINMHMNNLVFIDVPRVAAYPMDLQVAAILEEFVHAMMNIPDEVLVKHVVAHLYPRVSFDGVQYTEA